MQQPRGLGHPNWRRSIGRQSIRRDANRRRSCAGQIAATAAACLLLLLPFAAARAHDARPLAVTLAEQASQVYRVTVRVPPSITSDNVPSLEWPADCQVTTPAERARPAALAWIELVHCDAPIDGQRIGIRYPLFNPSLSTVARFTPLAGAVRTAVLPPDETGWTVPSEPGRIEVARDYLALGVEHIWAGADHLLFVIGLLLLARSGRRILLVITGFTIAHSITLSLSALGFIELAVPPIEAAIALSIVFLAAELARPDPQRLARRYPLIVSSTFGLLHGLGFAAALGEIGLPASERLTALLFFNVGVELGQIAFILPFVAAAWAWQTCDFGRRFVALGTGVVVARQRLMPYGIGVLAAFWFVQRLAGY
jgi:hydrogenase/urease accessory protein HupE